MTVGVLWLFLTVGLQCVIVVFPDDTYLLFKVKCQVAIEVETDEKNQQLK